MLGAVFMVAGQQDSAKLRSIRARYSDLGLVLIRR